jgi:hypothetical protein
MIYVTQQKSKKWQNYRIIEKRILMFLHLILKFKNLNSNFIKKYTPRQLNIPN